MKRMIIVIGALTITALGFGPAAASGSATLNIPGNHTELANILPGAHPNAAVYSTNWAGVAATGDTFRSVSATYSVPSVNCAKTASAFAYQWVGLDGYNNSTVEQDGVAGYCVSGTPTYFAWSEMYPADLAVQFSVNPGDAIRSSVSYNVSTRLITLALTDVTAGQSFSRPEVCAGKCARSNAEVISEGYPVPSYDGTADYGIENYENIVLTDRLGNTGGFTSTSWRATTILQKGTSVDAEPSAIYGGQAFSNTWLAES